MNWKTNPRLFKTYQQTLWDDDPVPMDMQPRDWYQLALLVDHPFLTPTQLDALVKLRYPTVPSPNGKTQWETSSVGLTRRRRKMLQAKFIAVPEHWITLHVQGLRERMFHLTDRGVRALAQYSGKDFYWTRRDLNGISPEKLPHFWLLNESFAAHTLALAKTQASVHSWVQDARCYEQVDVLDYDGEQLSRTTRQLMPDAKVVFDLGNNKAQVCYDEADLSGGVHLTSSVRAKATMLERYRAYWTLFEQSDQPFIVRTYTMSKQRMRNLQKLVRENEPWNGKKTGLFWFQHINWSTDNPHPVLDGWETAWGEPKSLLEKSVADRQRGGAAGGLRP